MSRVTAPRFADWNAPPPPRPRPGYRSPEAVAVVRSGESMPLLFEVDPERPSQDGMVWVDTLLYGRTIATRRMPAAEAPSARVQRLRPFRYPILLFAWESAEGVAGELYAVSTAEPVEREPGDPFEHLYVPDCDVMVAPQDALLALPRRFLGHAGRPAASRTAPDDLGAEALDLLRTLLFGDVDEAIESALRGDRGGVV